MMARTSGATNLELVDIAAIIERARQGESYEQIAQDYAVDPSTIGKHCRAALGPRKKPQPREKKQLGSQRLC